MTNINEFLKKDIKYMVKHSYHNISYLRGYLAACYNTGQIDKKTLEELKDYLAGNMDNIMRRKTNE